MKKKLNNILITGGAGFIGSNLIIYIKKNYNFNKIISIDNYYSGNKKNHIIDKKILYLKISTLDILNTKNKTFRKFKPELVFHFAEFSRIVPSFKKFDDCMKFNTVGTLNVIKYSSKNNSKLIYSGSSSKFGKEQNEHLSPYSFTKSKNIELIKNFNKWFGLKYVIVYFFNVYGSNQIKNHFMSAVIAIFEEQFKRGIPLTVVKPGTQKRDFTHVDDIVNGTMLAALNSENDEFQIGSGKPYKLIEVAKMFKTEISLTPERPGERFSGKADYLKAKRKLGYKPKKNLEKYIRDFIKR